MTSIEALPHNAVLHHAEMLGDEAVEALVHEATRLVAGYLRPAVTVDVGCRFRSVTTKLF